MKCRLLCTFVLLSFCRYSQGEAKIQITDNISLRPFARAGVDMINYNPDLSKEMQTTKDATAELGSSLNLAPRIGGGVSIGADRFRLKVGIDGRLNIAGGDGDRIGWYKVELQPYPPPQEEYAFTQMDVDTLSYIPFVGLEVTIIEESDESFPISKPWEGMKVFAEFGLPYNGFELRTGRDTYGLWLTDREGTWSGFGKSVKGGVTLKLFGRGTLYLAGGREWYSPDFDGGFNGEGGDIGGFLFSVDVCFTF